MLRTLINFRWIIIGVYSLTLTNQLTVIESQASSLGGFQYQQPLDQQSRFYSPTSNQQQFNRYFGHELRLHKLDSDNNSASSNATCNDGSPAGYYMRLNRQSKRWVIYLQGGFFCTTDETCRERWLQNPDLMSSNHWAEFKTGKW